MKDLPSKKAINQERAKFIADSLATAPRRAALARAMTAGPLPSPFFDTHRYLCDNCGWTKVSSMHVSSCPSCHGALGLHRVPPPGVMDVWLEKPE